MASQAEHDLPSAEARAAVEISPGAWAPLQLDSRSALPLYHQLAEQLAATAQNAPPHTAIPSEKELMDLLGVSRATVRNAIRELVGKGVLYTRQGLGTFVAPIETALDRLTGFTASMKQLGRAPSTSVVRAEVVEAPPEVVSALGLRNDALVALIERVRCIDGIPCMVESAFLADALFPGIVDAELEGSLYDIMNARFAIRPERGYETITIAVADERVAHQLHVGLGTALIETIRRTFTDSGKPVEYTRRTARSDLVSLRVSLDTGAGFVDHGTVISSNTDREGR